LIYDLVLDMIRPEVRQLVALGAFPSSNDADLATGQRQQQLLESIKRPISDEEARSLIKVFGPDDYFGLAWTVLHLIESAPGWPLRDCLEGDANEWITRLRESAKRGGLL
jgi:hypothetical protein